MKPKKYSEVTYIAVKESINRDFKILSIFSIAMTIIALIICICAMNLSIKYEALKIENNELNKVVEMQKSIISDLQEDNIKLQEMIK